MSISAPPFELHVYRSPKDEKTIYGEGTYPAIIQGNRTTWPCVIGFGTPVQAAYDTAIEFTRQCGIELRVKDPDGLLTPQQ